MEENNGPMCDCGHSAADHYYGDAECVECSCVGLVAPAPRRHEVDEDAVPPEGWVS